jgi:hypothetical protein
VEHDAGQQEVAIDVGIVRGHGAGENAEGEHVLEQAAQEGMMDLLGGGGAAP